MRFIADLHIHSKYSMATSSDLDLEHLYMAAQYKGIQLVATGDATHPAWFSELETKLSPAEPGFYLLKEEIRKKLDPLIPSSCKGPVRFILSSEISSIYKKGGKVRKNHNLVFFPDLESQKKFNAKLSRIGNIVSDGRPILGLDAKDLLRISLDTHPEAFLVPAHIWTPWFSMLGSKSGFDHIEECFEDLAPEIFAVETGLSSDPSMNERVSFLDRLSLISNSDAHSPGNLGREANLFHTDFHYPALVKALKEKGSGAFIGTYEFYPEEGKYHLDGHRKCGVSLTPEESLNLKGICPVCEKPLTLGVLYRVNELADRPPSFVQEEKSLKTSFSSLVPLPEVLSQIMDCGPKTKKVTGLYEKLLRSYGSEFSILFDVEAHNLKDSGIPLIDEAILRVRQNKIHIEGGYDGNYGKVEIFSPLEKEGLLPQKKLFQSAEVKNKRVKKELLEKPLFFPEKKEESVKKDEGLESTDIFSGLNSKQKEAVLYTQGPSLIMAGPGTGKTRTLTRKISWFLQNKEFSGKILAITFTRKAADEMRERLSLIHGKDFPVDVFTFHALCFQILEHEGMNPKIPDANLSRLIAEKCIKKAGLSIRPALFEKRIADIKKKMESGAVIQDEDGKLFHIYKEEMRESGFVDFDALVDLSLDLLRKDEAFSCELLKRYQAIFIDEFQDIDSSQYTLVRFFSKNLDHITIIGDPNQSIYGFRGGSPLFFDAFKKDWPETKTFHLVQNYRSSTTILDAAWQLLSCGKKSVDPVFKVFSHMAGPEIRIKAASDEKREADWIADTIQKSVGGTGHHVIYAGRDGEGEETSAFSDIAVLVRTKNQARVICEVFEKKGIPYQIAGDALLYENEKIKRLLAEFRIVAGLAPVSDLLHQPFSMEFKESFVRSLFEKNPFLFPFFEEEPLLSALFEKRKTMADQILSPKDSAELLELLIKKGEDFSQEELLFAENLVFRAKGKNYKDFFSGISMEKEVDLLDFKVEKVRILTLHASKGLEFTVLFLAGCEKGFLPHEREDTSVEEERRLFYVGLTRAKNILWISWAKKRRVFGKTETREVSPFLTELENFLSEIKEGGKKTTSRKKKMEDQQMSLFED